MPDSQNSVFISYRRDVSSFIARAVFMDLRAHGYDVFMDVESIDSGEFGRIILNQIAARAHFLLILTRGTLERCVHADDWLRREIEHAIDLQRNIIPVLVNDFRFDATELSYLTGKLAVLPSFSGLDLPHSYFDEAMDRLRKRFLKPPAYTVDVQPTPVSDAEAVQRKIAEAASQPPPTQETLTAEQWLQRGFELNDNSDVEIGYYTRAIEIDPLFAPAYYNRAICRKARGDVQGAIADYTEAIRADPQHAKAYNNRGVARDDLGDREGAIADYTEAIRLNPQYADAYFNRGIAHKALDRVDQAIADYTEAIRLNPNYWKAYFNRGAARRAQGDIAGAEADYSEAILRQPDHINAHYNRGLARQALGNFAGAIEDFQRYLDLGGGERDGDSEQVEQRIRELRAQLG